MALPKYDWTAIEPRIRACVAEGIENREIARLLCVEYTTLTHRMREMRARGRLASRQKAEPPKWAVCQRRLDAGTQPLPPRHPISWGILKSVLDIRNAVLV